MNKIIENIFFASVVTAFGYFINWCVREMRRKPVHREFTQEELQEIWEQQQQEKYERELAWEAEDD